MLNINYIYFLAIVSPRVVGSNLGLYYDMSMVEYSKVVGAGSNSKSLNILNGW